MYVWVYALYEGLSGNNTVFKVTFYLLTPLSVWSTLTNLVYCGPLHVTYLNADFSDFSSAASNST